MALIKRALYQGEQDGEPLIQIVQPGEMVKTASIMPEVQNFISKLRPEPGCTYTLVNAMGYSEYYGANANKDYYGYNKHLNFNGLLHAPPDWGADPANDRARGKKWYYGFPTYYGATVYAHHKNSDPHTLGFGDVVLVMPNDRMKRIELVMRVDHDLAHQRGRASILERIRLGERVDVSMGCKVPFDLCSICTDWDAINQAWTTFDPARHAHPGIAILKYHKEVMPIRGLSITRADYCEHMRKSPGLILPDGRKVFVYNDFPRFFDISFVWIGADRTARVMWHLSPEKTNDIEPREQIQVTMGPRAIVQRRTLIVKEAMQKVAGDTIFHKSSEIMKEVPATWAKKIELHTLAEPDLPTDILEHATDAFGPHALLSTLAALGIVAKPREFHIIVTRGKPFSAKLASLAAERGQEFTTHLDEIDDSFAVSGHAVNPDLGEKLSPAADARSSFGPHLAKRLMQAPPKSVLTKESRVLTSDVMRELGAQYNGYRLSLLENAGEVFPKYAEFFKTSGLGDKALLLGLGPVIHLLSAHLRKKEEAGQELGAVSKFVADNPLFTSMSTIGAGLRAAMAVDKAGGIIPAVKNVARVLKKALL